MIAKQIRPLGAFDLIPFADKRMYYQEHDPLVFIRVLLRF